MSHPIKLAGFLLSGALLGAAVGSLGVFNYCYLLSRVQASQAMAVGWVFCLFTFPIGVILGGALGIRASRQEETPWGADHDGTYAPINTNASLGGGPRMGIDRQCPGATCGQAFAALISAVVGLSALLAGGVIVNAFGIGNASRLVAMVLLTVSPIGFLAALGLGLVAKRRIRDSGSALAGNRLAVIAMAVALVGLSPAAVTAGLLLLLTAIALSTA